MFILNSNEPIKGFHLQKLADQSMLNRALGALKTGKTLVV